MSIQVFPVQVAGGAVSVVEQPVSEPAAGVVLTLKGELHHTPFRHVDRGGVGPRQDSAIERPTVAATVRAVHENQGRTQRCGSILQSELELKYTVCKTQHSTTPPLQTICDVRPNVDWFTFLFTGIPPRQQSWPKAKQKKRLAVFFFLLFILNQKSTLMQIKG